MTPRFGFLERTSLGLALGSALSLASCGLGPTEVVELARPGHERVLIADRPPVRSIAPSPIDDSLARLEALEVLDVTDLVTTRTEHTWIPYGGYWSEVPVEMGEAEVAERLERFVAVAETAAASVTEIPEHSDALCWPLDDHFCLTKVPHEADVSALDDLEIVDVAGVVRDHETVDGFCYSSWETVNEATCLRALKAHAIVEATADFPNRRAPEEDGE